ncbi:hypothetical protein BGX26_004718 [Mortierella sp. AD094]|nr:hypothetical protein BGX26_004718 [Mortierella sp. AD094]
MRSMVGRGSICRSWNLQTKTFVILFVMIVISACTVMRNIDLMRFDVYFGNKSTSNRISSSITNDHNDNQYQGTHYTASSAQLGPLEPAVSLLNPDTKYLSYFPHAGITNQFISLQAAGFAAKKLNRTLILPPLISNTHDTDNTHQRWSIFLDLPKFTRLTGVRVQEWDLVRPLTPTQQKIGRDQATFGNSQGTFLETDEWARVAENITCQVIFGYGTPELEINPSSWNFVWHFLFRPVFKKPPPPPVSGMPANVTEESKEPDVLTTMDDIIARYRDNKDQLLLFSHTYKILDPHFGRRFWDEIGANLHFVPQLRDYTTLRVNEEVKKDEGIEVLPNDLEEEEEEMEASPKDEPMESIIPTNKNLNAKESGEPRNPAISKITTPAARIPYIAVHFRRGDIGDKCTEVDMLRCLIPFEVYEDAIARAREDAAKRGLHSRLPVVVTTDTTSLDDLRKMKQLGWHRMDHAKYGTEQLWGSFGGAMVDAVVLANADVFVGNTISSMDRIAVRRQTAWHHRNSVYAQQKLSTTKRSSSRSSSTGMKRRNMMTSDSD